MRGRTQETMYTKKETTLRLNMPQWQGGNRHKYYFGSELLAWLAPPANGPVETIAVPEPKPGEALEVEDGILGRKALLRQFSTALDRRNRNGAGQARPHQANSCCRCAPR